MANKSKGQDGSKKATITRRLSILLLSLTVFVVFFEFFYDLKKEIILNRIVLILNLALLAAYYFLAWKKLHRNKLPVLEFIQSEKADVAYFILVVFFSFLPRLAAALVIVRLMIFAFMRGLETKLGTRLLAALNLRPSQTLVLGFMGLIAAGTTLLMFPAATTNGKGATFINALFTMTSASCVAGLTVSNIGADFTQFGQAVIVFGMQVGGLGIMFLSAAFAVLVGGTIPARHQAGLTEVLDVSTPEGLKSLIRAVTATTVIMESIGAAGLFIFTIEQIPKATDRLWWSVFHSVSAFCNAGMSLSKDSLLSFVNAPMVCFVFMVLISSGGIGFFVISDLTSPEVWRIKKPRAIWNRLQIQTKVVIIATILLDFLGMLLFLFFEYDGALHGLDVDKKIVASLFHAISLRSAGFNVVPIGNIVGPTVIFSIAFMFIGASPGSTGGGIKTTTAAISVMSLRAMLRGREDVELFGRRVSPFVVNRSLSIVLVAAMIVAIFLTFLLATQQDIEFENLFFETVSAFGTVGLSMDTTRFLDDTGKILIVLVMYIGRIGPLTLALAVGERRLAQGYLLPKGSIAVG